jgi:hypothetical protein
LHRPFISSRSHVGACLDTFRRVLRDLRLEARLNVLEHLLVLIAGEERDGQALGTESTRTTDTMEVRVSIGGHVVVDCEVDALDIDTTAEDIGRDADALVEFFEFLVALDAAMVISNCSLLQEQSMLTAPLG